MSWHAASPRRRRTGRQLELEYAPCTQLRSRRQAARKPRYHVPLRKRVAIYGDSPVTIYRKIAAGKLIASKVRREDVARSGILEEHYTSLPRFVGKTGQAA